MFSAQQLKNFGPKKQISQQTFDEAVKENVDEFDMEVRAAVCTAPPAIAAHRPAADHIH